MRNQQIYLASVIALLVGGCGSIQDAENGGGNPEDAPTIESITPNRVALAGGVVTVSGTGFFEDIEVVLGTRRHTDFVVTNEVEIQLTIPPGTAPEETLALALLADTGAASLDSAITYNDVPTITSTKPPISPVGSGGTITISGTLFQENNNGRVTVTLGNTELTDVTVVDDSTITATIGPGSAEILGIAEDLVVETPNGSATREAAHTYVGSGLLLSLPRPRSPGGVGVFNPDEGLGLYFADPVSRRLSHVLPLKSGIGKLVRNTEGKIGVRFTGNGSEAIGRLAFGVVDLVEGRTETTGIIKPPGPSFESMKIRTMTNINGIIYAIADREAQCCGGQTEFGTINTTTHAFTLISDAPSGLNSNACLVQGTGTSLLGFNFNNTSVKNINTNTGVAVDGPAFTGDLTLPDDTDMPVCHGAARIGTTVYAIQYFRSGQGKSRLVTVDASGLVSFVMDLPDGSGGLVAIPAP